MIKVSLTNEILKRIALIDENRFRVGAVNIPANTKNRLRKNSKKMSSFASNKIEGNPLSQAQVEAVIDRDEHKHLLKPEQEVRNYYIALNLLEEMLKDKKDISLELILKVQAAVEMGASKEKIGLRKAMPPGVLFAVYDSETGMPDYIPPQHTDIIPLVEELVEYINTTDDHPLIVAAVAHYQLVTIHPFEDGNGRTARLISGYILDLSGYGFGGIGSLEEYFAYDSDEYYKSLQMNLPADYYAGRDNPPNPEIWINYFLRMVELYSNKAYDLSREIQGTGIIEGLSYLNTKDKEFLLFLLKRNIREFTPIDMSKLIGVTNRTIINRCVTLAQQGFIIPVIVKTRVRKYRLSSLATDNMTEIINAINK